MPNHIKPILTPKRLRLWQWILRENNYPDLEVFDEITGPAPAVKGFEPAFKPGLSSQVTCRLTQS